MPDAFSATAPSAQSTALRCIGLLALTALTVALAIKQYQFVDHYALNIMFSDQWDLYRPILSRQSWWTLFTFQHGPHRQGVGFLIMPLLSKLSGANTRWDAFATSYTLIAACILALILGYKCGIKSPLALLPVPLIFFTVREYESFTAAANLSHGAMPMLLFTAICLAWFINNHMLRTAVISLLTFASIFTGFGIFVGLLIPVIFAIESFQAYHQNQTAHALIALAGIAACALSWGLFSIGYVFEPANPTFHFPDEHPLQYFGFVAIMLSNFYGAADQNPFDVPIGLLLTAALVLICLLHLKKILQAGALNQRRSVILFLLCAYALIYCFNTAIGRVSMGWKAAPLSSRYVILMIPAAFAISLQLATLKRKLYAIALPLIFTLIIAPGALQLTTDDRNIINVLHHDNRIRWRNAYFVTHDEMKANLLTGTCVYPYPGRIKAMLYFMEKNHLNFFQDAPIRSKPNPAPSKSQTPSFPSTLEVGR